MSSDPLAYFITFHTYGTWLHGDGKGSVDRNHNAYGAPLIDPNERREDSERCKLKHQPLTLDAMQRWVVHHTVTEVCEHRKWLLHALHVRTNHVHVVVTAHRAPERVMNDLKSWCTRRMREAGVLQQDVQPWTHHGSTRYIWTEDQLAERIGYVRDQQGTPLPMVKPTQQHS